MLIAGRHISQARRARRMRFVRPTPRSLVDVSRSRRAVVYRPKEEGVSREAARACQAYAGRWLVCESVRVARQPSPTQPNVSRRAEATRSFASLPDQAGGKRTQDDSTTLFCGMLSAPPLQQYLIGRRRNTSANATPTAFSSPHDPICCTANCGQAGTHNWPLRRSR